MSEDQSLKKFFTVMGLALGLPSTIVGLFFLLNELVKRDVISWNTLLIILLVVVLNILGLMVRHVLVKKNKQP
jgi:hypothetical protein